MPAIHTSLISRLMNYYRAEQAPQPVISSATAAWLSISFTLIYVLPFYLSSKTRPSPSLTRDAPSVIRARVRAVTFSSILTSCLAIWLSISKGHFTIHEALHILGYWPISLLDLTKTFLLVATLFLGPLFERAVCEGQWREWIKLSYWTEALETPTGWRTYVAGPITEEVVFRSTIIAVHLLARVSPSNLVFVTPLYFGIAHVHHFYETTLTHPHTPTAAIMLRTVVQFAYTSLFGFFAAFLLLRTGNVYACILAHSFCNAMGLPRVWGRIEGVETPVAMAPEGVIRGRDTRSAGIEMANGRLGMQWTVAYYVLLVLGAWLFYNNLWTWSESANALVEFSGAVER